MTQEEDNEDNTPYWLRINQHIVGAKEEEEHDNSERKREKREEEE